MFQLDQQRGTLANLNCRAEKHGEEESEGPALRFRVAQRAPFSP